MFETFKGQERLKAKLSVVIHQGKINKKMPHVGFFAPAGFGKTTLAGLVAKELGAKYIYMNGTAIKEPVVFANKIYKATLNPNQHHIIFIDEAHTLPRKIQDNLLSVLEEPSILCFAAPTKMKCARPDGSLRIVKKGEVIQIALPNNISFILGTTDKGQLQDTILSRIIEFTFDFYSENDIVQILTPIATLPDILIRKVASISRNGRDAKKYLKGLESFIDMNNIKSPNVEHFEEFCSIYGITHDGLTQNDVIYLSVLMEHGPIGLQNIAAIMGIKIEEITNTIEPYLLKQGLVVMTPKGRELGEKGTKRMGDQNKEEMFIIKD